MGRESQKSLGKLVKRCLRGEKQAWVSLIEIISPVIFSICRKMKLSREESFDIYGQVCYLLLQNISRLKDEEKVISYVATITRREIYALYRKSKIFEYLDESVLSNISREGIPDQDQILEATRRGEKLMKALVLLPERDYKLIMTLFFDKTEPSYKETSRKLGIPVSSIGPTRARSLEKLLKILKKKRFEF
ncbi:MAG: RNA polymerase sigma factor [Candidatus Zixiibacteriota bacterium]